MKGKFTRKAVLCCWAIRLGLACLLLTGTALAGGGDLTEAETRFTTTDCSTNLTNADQVYTMGIARSAEQDFVARYTLNLGFFGSIPAVPVVGGSGTAGITHRSGGLNSREVEYEIDVTGAFTAGTTTLTLPAPAVRFPGDSGAGTTMTITIDLRDGSGPIDTSGVKTRDLAVLFNGCAVRNAAPTAVDDSASTKEGVAISIDVLRNDSDPDGDTLSVARVTQPTNGSVVISSSLDQVIYTPANKFEGTDSFSYTVTDGKGGTDTAIVTVSVIANTVLLANFLNGNTDSFNSRVYLWNPSTSAGNVTVRVFTLPLSGGLAQELTVTLPLSLGTLGARSALNVKLADDILTPLGITTPYITDGGNLTLEFTIQAPDVRSAAQVFSDSFAFGVYPLQEIPSTSSGSPTVLVANFLNGNDDAFNSRVYLWNTSFGAGNVTVRVFTLPLSGGLAQELTVAPFDLGTLAAKSALNVKLAEDIMTPLGITPPYTTDGGNLTLEFTIQAPDVRGVAQVFSSSFAFGTYPLQAIPSTASGSPTVLVANFLNGNDAAFNSRVYLWNPSTSPGEVTVRVFTLPLTGGLAQEMTNTPLSLGTLAAKSALTVKLAEDVLTPLGLLPYTENGGNLTLEFTIEAENVRGTAQVFSDSLAFGTYPLEVIQ